jgi:cytochrome oxidase Cu insertion factor (SCO1/SenC/PrrC family)
MLSAEMMSELSSTQMPPSENNAPGNGRKILLILAVIFLLPFTVAATLHLLQVKPGGRSYGDLVKPPLNLKFPVLHDIQGKTFGAARWQKKWSIVMVDTTRCTEACQTQVYMLKQVRTSLGKEIQRVQQVLLVPAEIKGEAFNELQKKYPDLIVLVGADAETVRFAGEFNLSGQPAGYIYLVDPLGNLMMTYSKNKDPKGLRSDLTHLLKNSWAG